MEVSLNQSSSLGTGGHGRQLVIVDKNRDMWITGLNKISFRKMGTMIDTFAWHDEIDMIGAMADGKFVVWYYPNAIFIDQDIAPLTRFERDGRHFYILLIRLVRLAEMLSLSHFLVLNAHCVKPTVRWLPLVTFLHSPLSSTNKPERRNGKMRFDYAVTPK